MGVFCVFTKEKWLSDTELRRAYGDNTVLEKTA